MSEAKKRCKYVYIVLTEVENTGSDYSGFSTAESADTFAAEQVMFWATEPWTNTTTKAKAELKKLYGKRQFMEVVKSWNLFQRQLDESAAEISVLKVPLDVVRNEGVRHG